MYASGVPLGMLVDYKGPRWGVAVGVVFFALGYYPIAKGLDVSTHGRPVLRDYSLRSRSRRIQCRCTLLVLLLFRVWECVRFQWCYQSVYVILHT